VVVVVMLKWVFLSYLDIHIYFFKALEFGVRLCLAS
jgi:hypothetical protein